MINLAFIVALVVYTCTALDESKTAKLINYDFDNIGAGPYNFRFETSDGIKREETGNVIYPDTDGEHLVIRGSFSYTDGDGKVYKVDYTADDNGFHPEGDHIKVPPFVPWIHHKHHHPSDETKSSVFPADIKLTRGFNVPSTAGKPERFSVTAQYIPTFPRSIPFNTFTTAAPRFNNGGSIVTSKTYIPSTPKPIHYDDFDGNALRIK